ncbi:hypothetical protein BDY24DRAFT_414637 [Mrakia frigida]|uniref:uncharacterized protein n=1 Tax=Mrakia frigida TaxID=29902 RepID=UPI003FCBF143
MSSKQQLERDCFRRFSRRLSVETSVDASVENRTSTRLVSMSLVEISSRLVAFCSLKNQLVPFFPERGAFGRVFFSSSRPTRTSNQAVLSVSRQPLFGRDCSLFIRDLLYSFVHSSSLNDTLLVGSHQPFVVESKQLPVSFARERGSIQSCSRSNNKISVVSRRYLSVEIYRSLLVQ